MIFILSIFYFAENILDGQPTARIIFIIQAQAPSTSVFIFNSTILIEIKKNEKIILLRI
jgi:hypothetical protein